MCSISHLNAVSLVLNDFFKEYLPHLKAYKWGRYDYDSCIEYKQQKKDAWNAGVIDKTEIAQDIVAEFGGIKSNNKNTIKKYVIRLLEDSEEYSLQGIASYSKIYAVIKPEKYNIYDSRVAACLNAVQYNYGSDFDSYRGFVFHYLPGNNKTIGRYNHKIK